MSITRNSPNEIVEDVEGDTANITDSRLDVDPLSSGQIAQFRFLKIMSEMILFELKKMNEKLDDILDRDEGD